MSKKRTRKKAQTTEKFVRPSGRRPVIPQGFPMRSRLSRREKERVRRHGHEDWNEESSGK